MISRKILIIGLGRFGTLLAQILKPDFELYVWNRSDKKQLAEQLGVTWVELEQGIKTCGTIFYCVPISALKKAVKSHLKFYCQSQPKLIIDVLSVKVLPKTVLKQHLPDHCRVILTHPIFGPDSVAEKGLAGHRIMIDNLSAGQDQYRFWKQYWQDKQLQIIEVSAEEHDRLAANSQGVAFFLSRVLQRFGFEQTAVDTYWAQQLYQIKQSLSNDSWQLFVDLQVHNPYTKQMRVKLGQCLDQVYNQLLPEQVDSDRPRFGIQGGRGSFNHEALKDYTQRHNISDYQVEYLFTSARVLQALHQGNIDYGLFAVHNSLGGVVQESVQAMAQYKFRIMAEFAIPIRHFLMKRWDSKAEAITTIMTHPQVTKQCRQNLNKKYSQLKLISGDGELIDHAKAAQELAAGRLSNEIAVIGSKTLAEIYDLEIIDQDLQDNQTNLTSFFLVGRVK